ncbi:hypothetical protein NUU61_010109 [Penicillium alfredii]|uniref:Uncharacterized protein n=1 Tax=Penicillium alfredii TaxID=1506179 RepID=A0A9W9EHI1_9EURO|nr:uncharacterized protein NUU61_010109 [Penicillium alfredii]KAJ5081845.1 hypothetical protein NUU61_010109 [Penicillium alfredii]
MTKISSNRSFRALTSAFVVTILLLYTIKLKHESTASPPAIQHIPKHSIPSERSIPSEISIPQSSPAPEVLNERHRPRVKKRKSDTTVPSDGDTTDTSPIVPGVDKVIHKSRENGKLEKGATSLFYTGLPGGVKGWQKDVEMCLKWAKKNIRDKHRPNQEVELVAFGDVISETWRETKYAGIVRPFEKSPGASLKAEEKDATAAEKDWKAPKYKDIKQEWGWQVKEPFEKAISTAFAQLSAGVVYLCTPNDHVWNPERTWGKFEYPVLTRESGMVSKIIRYDPFEYKKDKDGKLVTISDNEESPEKPITFRPRTVWDRSKDKLTSDDTVNVASRNSFLLDELKKEDYPSGNWRAYDDDNGVEEC